MEVVRFLVAKIWEYWTFLFSTPTPITIDVNGVPYTMTYGGMFVALAVFSYAITWFLDLIGHVANDELPKSLKGALPVTHVKRYPLKKKKNSEILR